MRVGVLTREYPPEVYGGAGVHVEFLVRELRRLADVDVQVHCFGAPRTEPGVHALPGAGRADRSERRAADARRRPARWPHAVGDVDVAALAHLVREPGRASSAASCTACRTC